MMQGVQWQSSLQCKGVLRSHCGRFALTERTDGWTLADFVANEVTRAREEVTLRVVANLRAGLVPKHPVQAKPKWDAR